MTSYLLSLVVYKGEKTALACLRPEDDDDLLRSIPQALVM